jgi:hypothetical protein
MNQYIAYFQHPDGQDTCLMMDADSLDSMLEMLDLIHPETRPLGVVDVDTVPAIVNALLQAFRQKEDDIL